jgi:hypothetical protein
MEFWLQLAVVFLLACIVGVLLDIRSYVRRTVEDREFGDLPDVV